MSLLQRAHTELTADKGDFTSGCGAARAIDYSMVRSAEMTCYNDGGDLPADNNWAENWIRSIALGRNKGLYSGSLRSGKRAAAVMGTIHSARLNGHELRTYPKSVMERLPTQ